MLIKTMMMLSALYYSVFAATVSYEREEYYTMQEGDKVVYSHGPCGVGKPYSRGALWLRMSSEGEVLCYKDDWDALESTGAWCYKVMLKDARFCSDRKLNDVLKGALSEVGVKRFEQALSEGFPSVPPGVIPKGDLMCAAVRCIREGMSGVSHITGDFDKDFQSWACFLPRFIEGRGKKIIHRSEVGEELSISFVKDGEGDRPVIIYTPDCGLGRLSYCCDLENSKKEWPKNWQSVFDAVQKYADAPVCWSDVCAGGHAEARAMMIKAFLTGRCAAWDESVWFAWRPVVQENDAILRVKARNTTLGGDVSDGHYRSDVMWLVPFGADRALRYRPEEDPSGTPVFQFFPAAQEQPQGSFAVLCDDPMLEEYFEKMRSFILDYGQ